MTTTTTIFVNSSKRKRKKDDGGDTTAAAAAANSIRIFETKNRIHDKAGRVERSDNTPTNGKVRLNEALYIRPENNNNKKGK